MQNIIVDKLNDVYIRIDADASIRRELSDYFSFEVPGYKFTPQFRNRVWDGKIRLYSYATGQMYVGLYPYLKDWCNKKSVHIVESSDILTHSNVTAADIDGMIEEYDLSIRPRDYQIEAYKFAIEHERGMVVSPTASGKSLIIYALIRYYNLLLRDKKILILVPTTSLVEQMYSDFIDYGWDDKYLHRIYQGHEKETDKRIVISTWQSIYKMPKKFFEQFGMVVGDEAHLFKAVSLTKIMSRLENCKYRIGLTGTLDDSKTHKLVLEGLFGAVNKIVSTTELQEKEHLAKLKIHCLVLQHEKMSIDFLRGKTYQEEMDFLVSNTKRNKYIRNLCLDLKGNSLCLFQYVEKHGMILKEMIEERSKDKQVFFVYGGVEAHEREKIRAITEKSDNAIIIASYGTFSTGINIRNLHNIVFSSPSKSRIRNLQSIGRGLRLKDNNSEARLYDISDDLSYQEEENYTLSHFRERINIYNEEGFNYDIHNVEL